MNRSENYYFNACDAVWSAIVFYRMQNPRMWRLLQIVHNMGKDFALDLEQMEYVRRSLVQELGA